MISGQVLAAFEIDSVTGRIVLKMAGYGDLELGNRDGLAAGRNNLHYYLSVFKEKLDHPRRSLDSLAAAVKDLNSSMAEIAHILTDDDDGLLKKVSRRFVDAWPQWQRATDVVPVVEVRGHDDEFHSSFFPSSTDAHQRLREPRRSRGRAAPVPRLRGRGAPHHGQPVATEDLIASPRLPVQFLRYTTRRAADEAAYLCGWLPQIDMEGPWPAGPVAG